jgi:ABC-type branched-subunit amino acid transport system substrate-binding protein
MEDTVAVLGFEEEVGEGEEAEDDDEYDIEVRWRAELDGILIWADPEDIRQIVPQARALGFHGRFIGNASWGDPALRRILPEEIDSVVFVSDEETDNERSEWRAFVADYRSRFGRNPSWLAGRAFDAVDWLAHQTVDNPDPLYPLRRLTTTDDIEGVTATYRFSPDRQREEATVYRYIHGRPVRIQAASNAVTSSEP